MTAGGRVKVLDFGIARRTARPDEATRASTLGGTMSGPGLMVGTLGYMAPEQIEGAPAGPASDVFALGALLYHVLTGKPPFAGESIWAVMNATMRHEPPPVSSLKPGIPEALATIVSRALAKNPAARFPSAREMRDALAALVAERRPASSTARAHSNRAAIAAGAAIAVAIAATVGWIRVRDSRLQWARQTAIPEISRLATTGDAIAAYRMAQRAIAAAPDDPQVQTTWNGLTQSRPITSDPPGADVAILGPVYLAIEPRLKTSVLLSGGFETWTIPAETDPVNFAPRVTQPVLMVNGREDFDLPYETAQVPMFNMLGTAPADKRHAVLEGGHIPPRPQAVFKEILDWLDRYLGPVAQ
jgi:pimeloyl-ACP methyl ester carboxylesterase